MQPLANNETPWKDGSTLCTWSSQWVLLCCSGKCTTNENWFATSIAAINIARHAVGSTNGPPLCRRFACFF